MYLCNLKKHIIMQATTLTAKPLWRTLAVDAALAGAVCLIPWLHVAAPWAIQLNPMMMLLLVGMTVIPGRFNAFFLAMLLPAFSAFAVGMPTPVRAVCMAAEFSALVTAYSLLSTTRPFKGRTLASILLAMLCGKGVYYALKAFLGVPAALVGTDWWMQLASMLLWGGLFALAAYKGAR